ncbi:MAG TPA: 30S ribosomal protein S20 [Deltaproteobacteria bacterium]|nr:30S ribosomal protein S20 [Deltaproteobacteria bacterium]
MANHRSAAKRHRQSLKRRARNTAIKSSIKTAIKKVRESIARGDRETAEKQLRAVASKLDSAVSKGVLHRNNASRRIGRLARAVHSVQAS